MDGFSNDFVSARKPAAVSRPRAWEARVALPHIHDEDVPASCPGKLGSASPLESDCGVACLSGVGASNSIRSSYTQGALQTPIWLDSPLQSEHPFIT